MKTLPFVLLLASLTTLLGGCAKSSSSTADSETTGAVAFSAVDDATDAVADDASASVTASEMAMLQLDPKAATTDTDISVTRACTKSDTDGTVNDAIRRALFRHHARRPAARGS